MQLIKVLCMLNKDKGWIEDIIENIKDIEIFTRNVSHEEFLKSLEKQKAIYFSISVIGETAKRLSDEFMIRNKDIKWAEIAKMRDKLIHHYNDIDEEIVWKVIKSDIPVLKKALKNELKKIKKIEKQNINNRDAGR